MPVVVDANVAIKWILIEDLHLQARRLIEEEGENIHVPDLLLPETANIAWKKLREGKMTRTQVEEGLVKILDCLEFIYPSSTLLRRAMALSIAADHPIYDCFYLACAEAAEAVLITADRRLLATADRAGFAHLVRHLADIPP